MAYTEKIFVSPLCREHEISFAGNYGAKGEKRAEKRQATPEQIEKQNQRNRENRIRRLIQLNFTSGDYWITLKYPKGVRKKLEEVLKDFKKFRDNLRRRYKKADVVMKYIYRVEIGKQGGIHFHILLPRIPDGDMIISECWTKARGTNRIEEQIEDGYEAMDGLTDFTHIHPAGYYADLAEYITKDLPDGRRKDLSKEEQKKLLSYGCSRNLIRPVPEVKRYSHWTVRRLIDLGTSGLNTTPNRFRTEGFIIDGSTWVQGINPVTGMSYVRYTEIPIRRRT